MSTPYKTEDHVRAWLAAPTQSNRDRVVQSMEPVIKHIISRLNTCNTEILTHDDLFQAGIVGVLQALDQYRSDMDVRFVTFSWVRIRGEVIDLMRRLDPLPRRRRAKVAAMSRVENELAQQCGEWPAPHEVARLLRVDPSHVEITRLDAHRRTRPSLEARIGDAGEYELMDILENKSAMEPFDLSDWKDVSRHLSQASNLLSQREREIIDLFFNESLTQAEIGAFYGISEARVSQIRRKALEKMRSVVEPSLRHAA